MENFSQTYKELNELQRKAVDTTDGALLVLAGPGTGKTQLLSVRAGSIVRAHKARPENILILTYTNAAAKAMKERLGRIIGPAGYDIEVGTFHSFANTIIQDSAEAANYVGDRIPMSDVEAARALEYVLDNTDGLEEIRPFRSPYTYLREIRQKIGELKKDGVSPERLEAYLRDAGSGYHRMEEKHVRRIRALAIAYRRYEDLKTGKVPGIFDERGRYDFDDMILFAVDALRNEPGLLKDLRRQYLYVMVDEFQDTNGAQLELLFTLLDGKDPNLCCVGDDDQSIYRFQGASVGNFKELRTRYPGIRTIQLKDNYRSSGDLISMSHSIIGLIPASERVEEKMLNSVRTYAGTRILFKELTTEQEELLYIVEKVRELAGRIGSDTLLNARERAHPYNSIAVLVRKRSQILKVIDAFLQAGIPYATDGKEDISGEGRVRQLLDILELAHVDPLELRSKDLALYKVLSADYFGIPQADIMRLVQQTNLKRKSDPAATILGELLALAGGGKCRNGSAGGPEHPKSLRRAAEVIGALVADAGTEPVHKLLLEFIKNAGLFAHVLREYSDNDILRIRQLRGIGSFVNMVKASDLANPGIRLGEFLAELRTRVNHNLPIQGSLVTLTQAGVRVYTAHGSKGLEFHSVIIPFCLQNKSWPLRPVADRIPLPSDLFHARARPAGKDDARRLASQDETRLFYVATTRARSELVFTSSPTGDCVSTSYLDNLGITRETPGAESEEAVITRSIESTGARDPFIGTDEVLADLVDNLSLNPTRLNNYITCRRKFLYNDVLMLPGQKKKSLVFGNCVHKALEETYRRLKDTGSFPDFAFFESQFATELRFQGVDPVMERDCLNRMKTVRGWYDLAGKSAVVPIDLERKLLVTVGDNIIFNGKYDKVEWDDEAKGLVRIVDYKTGKPDDHIKDIGKAVPLAGRECDGYLRQLVAYRLLFEKDKKESRGRKASSGSLVFIEPVTSDMKRLGYSKGQYANLTVTITDAMVRDLEDLIVESWKNIRALRFERLKEREEDTCGNCDFNAICWGHS